MVGSEAGRDSGFVLLFAAMFKVNQIQMVYKLTHIMKLTG